MVRIGKLRDIPRLVEIGEVFVNSLKHLPEDLEYSYQSTTALMTHLVEDADSEIFVYEDNGEILGAIGVSITPYFFAPKWSIGTEYFFYILPDHRSKKAGSALLETYIQWAKDKGSDGVSMIAMSVTDKSHSQEIFEKYGFVKFETMYRMNF